MNHIESNTLASEKGLKFVHVNARSMYHKLSEIQAHYEFCDVIIITETWLNASIPDAALGIPGFRLIRQDRNKIDDKKGGGVCIYIKTTCTIEQLPHISEVTDDFELLGIKAKFPNIKPCYILGIYRPPKGKAIKLFDKLSNVLGGLDLSRNEFVSLGDMNIDYNSTAALRKLHIKHFESRFGVRQLIATTTRSTQTTATLLDWIFVNTEYISCSGTINHNLSDHFPIFFVRKKKRNKIAKKTVSGRSYLRYDTEVFSNIFTNKDWSKFDNCCSDPNKLWEIFQNHITETLDTICPIKELTVPEHKPRWLSNEILLLMRKRDKAYKVARKKKDDVSWRKAHFLRNRVGMMIKGYKKEKIQSELNINRANPKKFWNNIREIWPKEISTEVHSLKEEDGPDLYEGDELADHVNKYFANIGLKLANNISSHLHDIKPLYHTVQNFTRDEILSVAITEDELLQIIKKIDVNKSSAIENIRSAVIIDAFKSQLVRVVRMYNGSLTRCSFPTSWKEGTIIPLAKTSAPQTAGDMRPIALLPLPGKIMEHIVSIRLKAYLEEFNILTDEQHGFRKGRSTLSAIVEFLHTIYKNVNVNKDSYIIYLDLKKAFDTVSHELLLNKLKNIGLENNTINWFSCYLKNRTQRTRMNDCCSISLPVPYGVPQGSILGPTLFSIYINDLIHFVDCDLIFYADDTVILGKDPIILNDNLEKIYKWCNHNLLTINCKKSQWMYTRLTNTEDDLNPVFKIGGEFMSKVEEYRYLGITIDSKLNFQTHRNNMISNVNYKIIFFKKIRPYITTEAAKIIYKGTILPLIEYADFVFDYGIKYINTRIQSLQNQGLYTVFNQHYLSYDQKESTEILHRRANILRLGHRRWIHMLSFLFNYRYDANLLDVRALPTRRHNGVPFLEMNVLHHKVKQDPLYRSILAWNSLPVPLRNIDQKDHFKKLLIETIPNPYNKIV